MVKVAGVNEPWIDSEKAAEHLGTTVRHLHKLTHRNAIPHGKVGKYLRFKISELDSWMRESAQVRQEG